MSYPVSPGASVRSEIEALSTPGFRKWAEGAAKVFEQDKAKFKTAAKAFTAKTKKKGS